jgi:hypothetical protein
MNEPILATFAHPWIGQLNLVLSTYQLEVGAERRRIPYLWVGREDGETIATLTVILKEVKPYAALPPNHTWVVLRPALTGLRDLLLDTGVVRDTGVIYGPHHPPAELWEYQLPPPS